MEDDQVKIIRMIERFNKPLKIANVMFNLIEEKTR